MTASKMLPKNRRSVESLAIHLEATADEGLEERYEGPLGARRRVADKTARQALQRAAKVLRRALDQDDEVL